jgi:hypothetical protein
MQQDAGNDSDVTAVRYLVVLRQNAKTCGHCTVGQKHKSGNFKYPLLSQSISCVVFDGAETSSIQYLRYYSE